MSALLFNIYLKGTAFPALIFIDSHPVTIEAFSSFFSKGPQFTNISAAFGTTHVFNGHMFILDIYQRASSVRAPAVASGLHGSLAAFFKSVPTAGDCIQLIHGDLFTIFFRKGFLIYKPGIIFEQLLP